MKVYELVDILVCRHKIKKSMWKGDRLENTKRNERSVAVIKQVIKPLKRDLNFQLKSLCKAANWKYRKKKHALTL